MATGKDDDEEYEKEKHRQSIAFISGKLIVISGEKMTNYNYETVTVICDPTARANQFLCVLLSILQLFLYLYQQIDGVSTFSLI